MSKIISTGNQTFNNNPIQKGKLQAQQMLLFIKCVIVFAFLQLSKNVQSIRGRNVFFVVNLLEMIENSRLKKSDLICSWGWPGG